MLFSFLSRDDKTYYFFVDSLEVKDDALVTLYQRYQLKIIEKYFYK